MSKSIIQVRVDDEVKTNSEIIFKALGITISDAINIFLRQAIWYGGIPLELKVPNSETLRTIEDSENNIGLNKFENLDEMMTELNKE